ncbi:MAG: thymidylate synthase [Lachnospiraceae bacterium]|nr:thymidylate synthase [Lachnospiraceae bacterium]
MSENFLPLKSREEFRAWLRENSETKKECWLQLRRGKPVDPNVFYYIDAVEEALCFGWIDSVNQLTRGLRWQRFTPRKKNSPWSELNKERVRRLERLGLMTPAGRRVLPPMGPRSFKMDPEVEAALKKARVWTSFQSFPPLYRRVRAYNVAFFKKREPEIYQKALARLIVESGKGRMYGEWNDYGRLWQEEAES